LIFLAGTVHAQVNFFEDITPLTGIQEHPWAWGLTIADFNGDGRLDLFFTDNGEGVENWVYLAQEDGSYQPQSVRPAIRGSETAVPGDFDGDGDLDLLVSRWQGPLSLLVNDGQGSFTDEGVPPGCPEDPELRAASPAAADFDGDGDLDLCLPTGQGPDFLLENKGGKFADLFPEMEIETPDGSEHAAFADLNGDGRLDLLLVRTGASSVYHNDGTARFTDVTGLMGPRGVPGAFGATLFDMDNDGDLDLYLNRGALDSFGLQDSLFENDGQGRFLEVTGASGIGPARPTSFTCAAGDVDLDGDVDLFVPSVEGACCLLLNDGHGHFQEGTPPLLELRNQGAVGSLFVDLDEDGDLDLVVRSRGHQDRIFRSNLNQKNWLKVRVTGPHQGMGSQVRVFRPGPRGEREALIGYRPLLTGIGWCCHAPLEAHFGVPLDGVYDLEVRFPDGTVVKQGGVHPGQTVVVTRGQE